MSQDAVLDTVGLPAAINCRRAAPLYAGAAQSGDDIGRIDVYGNRFVMSIQWFNAPCPVHGLLMYDRGSAGRITGNIIPDRPAHVWYYFGYLCERCQTVFLVPAWVKCADDLPRALHHSCNGDSSPDYPQRLLRDRVGQAAAKLMVRLLLSDLIANKEANRVAQLIAAVGEVEMQKMLQEMDTLKEEMRAGRY